MISSVALCNNESCIRNLCTVNKERLLNHREDLSKSIAWNPVKTNLFDVPPPEEVAYSGDSRSPLIQYHMYIVWTLYILSFPSNGPWGVKYVLPTSRRPHHRSRQSARCTRQQQPHQYLFEDSAGPIRWSLAGYFNVWKARRLLGDLPSSALRTSLPCKMPDHRDLFHHLPIRLHCRTRNPFHLGVLSFHGSTTLGSCRNPSRRTSW
jgi:hypothetical protein